MAWVLSDERPFRHPKTGECSMRKSYHVGFLGGLFPEASADLSKARVFRTKNLAEVYNRNKLRGRGYKPERIEQEARA